LGKKIIGDLNGYVRKGSEVLERFHGRWRYGTRNEVGDAIYASQ